MSAARGQLLADAASTPAAARPWQRRDWLACAVIGCLLLGHFLIGVWTARSLSVTHDEYWHLPVGILNLRTWRFDYEPLNPPLTRLVSASLVNLANPGCYQGPVPVSSDSTTYGVHFLRLLGDHHHDCYVWGRAGNLVFSLLTGMLLAVWSWQWWGRSAACVTTLLWCTEPTVLAHAGLVTPDAGLSCLTCAVWYALWCYFQRPTTRRAIICGVLLGLAQLTKFTAIILVPLVCCTWLVWTWLVWTWLRLRASSNVPTADRTRLVWHPCVMLAVCLLLLNLGYGCEGTFSTLNQVQPRSRTVTGWMQRLPVLGHLPLPFPKSYLVGLDAQKHVMESRHPVYLDGVWSETGFRFYFLWALWYKLPHVWQILCVLAGIRLVWDKGDGTLRRQLTFALIPLLILLGTASLSGMQLGVRYVLPIYPFLCLLAASVFAATGHPVVRRWQPRLAIAVLLLTPLSLRYQPQHLAYFNELAGGVSGGAEHLLDSNLDWGQDLLELKAYLEKHADQRWGIAYFGSVPPGEIGLRYGIPPGRAPQPGSYAVSVNFVYGRPHVIFDDQGRPRAVGLEEFGYFRAFQPIKRIGASILIYHIRPSDILRWQTP